MDRRTITGLVAVIVILLAAWFTWHTLRDDRPLPPKVSFTCANGHGFKARIGAKAPSCPTCGEGGIQPTEFLCRMCNTDFVAFDRRKIDIGKFEFRMAGSEQWITAAPDALTCPHCGKTASLEGGKIVGKGYGKAADPDVIQE